MATSKAPAAKPAAEPVKKGSSLLVIIIVLLLGLGVGGGGAWFMAAKAAAKPAAATHAEEGDEAEAAEGAEADDGHGGAAGGKAEAIYIPLQPALVVNLEDMDAVRFLQVEIELQTHKASVESAVKLHTPALRNALLMLMSQQDYRTLLKVTGKEKLRQDALAEVRRVLKEQSRLSGVDNLYFTSFVSQ